MDSMVDSRADTGQRRLASNLLPRPHSTAAFEHHFQAISSTLHLLFEALLLRKFPRYDVVGFIGFVLNERIPSEFIDLIEFFLNAGGHKNSVFGYVHCRLLRSRPRFVETVPKNCVLIIVVLIVSVFKFRFLPSF
jgi:hypothetical protein